MEIFGFGSMEIAVAGGLTLLVGLVAATHLLTRHKRRPAIPQKAQEMPDGRTAFMPAITDDESEIVSRKLIRDIETVYAAQTGSGKS